MQTRFWVLIFGIISLVVGILGFIPALHTAPPAGAPHVSIGAANGLLFGLFPVNAVADVVHIILGLVGIGAFATLDAARYYSRFLALIFALAVVGGFIPQLDVLFGWMPIWGNDAWLHAVTAIISAYAGWVACEPTTESGPAVAHA